MGDDASIFGTDTSKYQTLGFYNPGAFEVVNFEDPQRDAKLHRNVSDHRPTGVYLWVYPRHDLFVDTVHMVEVIRGVFGGADPVLGYWADFEDPGGITEDQLHGFFAGLGARGARGGYYSGPFGANHRAFLDRDWWNAAYPTGLPSFPGYGSLWASSRPREMKMWQYTSNPLDQNVIVDNAWYHTTIGGVPLPPPEPPRRPKEDSDMITATLGGRANHIWSYNGALRYRAWSQGAPTGIIEIPPAEGSDAVKVDPANPRGLAIPGIGGNDRVFFAAADGREIEVQATGFGLQYRVF